MSEANERKQITSVYCPNCGIPRTAKVRIKTYLAKKGKVRYYCPACGFLTEMRKPGMGGKKKETEADLSFADLGKLGKAIKTVGSVVR